MSEIEPAFEFAKQLDQVETVAGCIPLIEADRAAVAKAVLDEIETKTHDNFEMGFRLDIAYEHAVFDVRAKYAQKGGG